MSHTTTKTRKAGRKKPAKGAARETNVGRAIVAALAEIAESLEAGERPEERFTVRTYRRPDPPKAYDAQEVKALRDRLNASQAVFASILAVSLKLVQSWEAGERVPAPVVCRLLETIEREPARWVAVAGNGRKGRTASAAKPFRFVGSVEE